MKNNYKAFIINILLVLFFDVKLNAQTEPTSTETIQWINDKLKTFSDPEIRIQKINIGDLEINNSVKILSIYDARGDHNNTFLTKTFINIDYIERISVRKESEFIAIDITPKEGRTCGIIGHPFWGKSFDYNAAIEFINADKFYIGNFAQFPFIQITLKKSSDEERIPERIVDALKYILKNHGIIISEDLF